MWPAERLWQCQYDCNACDRNSTWQIRWIAGVRYMLVDEKFQFATDRDSIVFGDNPDEELFYDIDVANHLVGGQIGCRIDRACMRRFSLHSDTKLAYSPTTSDIISSSVVQTGLRR